MGNAIGRGNVNRENSRMTNNIFESRIDKKRKLTDFNISDARKSMFAKVINEDIFTKVSEQRHVHGLMADPKTGLFDKTGMISQNERDKQEDGAGGR